MYKNDLQMELMDITEENIVKRIFYFKQHPTKYELQDIAGKEVCVYFDFNEDLDENIKNSTITHILFGTTYNKPLNNLPNGLKYLEFKHYHTFNQPIENLSEGLEYLIFNSGDFNHPITKLPSTLLYLGIESEFNKQIENLPDSLTHLFLYCDDFNQKINKFPINLQELVVFGKKYEHKLDNLPHNLKKLSVGQGYEEDLINLPEGLKYLETGCFFNQKLNLPDSIEELYFDWRGCFNQPIKKYPRNLKILHFGMEFNCDISNLPVGLEELKLGQFFTKSICFLPITLKKLIVCDSIVCDSNSIDDFDNLPEGLEELSVRLSRTNTIDCLPRTLKKLKIRYNSGYNRPLYNLPDGLEELELNDAFNSFIKLPANLENIKFGEKFNQYLQYPASLKKISFGKNYNQPSDNFQEGLKKITFTKTKQFGQSFAYLPTTVKTLSLYGRFTKIHTIPPTVKKIKIYAKFSHKIASLPNTIENLHFFNINWNRIKGSYPEGLKKIVYDNMFNSDISNLPDGVEFIRFTDLFNQLIEKYPSKLKVIEFGFGFNQKLFNLPDGLEEITIWNTDYDKDLHNLPLSLKKLRINTDCTCEIVKPESCIIEYL